MGEGWGLPPGVGAESGSFKALCSNEGGIIAPGVGGTPLVAVFGSADEVGGLTLPMYHDYRVCLANEAILRAK